MDVWPSCTSATSSMKATIAWLRVIDGSLRSIAPTAESQVACDIRWNAFGCRAGSSRERSSRSPRQAAASKAAAGALGPTGSCC